MHEKVNHILESARVRFVEWIGRYTPWHGDNGITERNLSFQFATAFLNLHPKAIVFMEVPFAATTGGPRSNHLDSYLHSANFELLLECKVVFGYSHIKAIAADINRMKPELLDQIHERHVSVNPTIAHGVVLAETWYPKIAKWWKGDDKILPKWSREILPPEWHYDCLEVSKVSEKNDGTLYWLYAVSPEIESAIKGSMNVTLQPGP